MYATIVEAIRNRERITLFYDPGERSIEPHAFGRGSEGQLLLRAYQVSGATNGGEPSDWKLFRFDQIGNARSGGQSFSGPRAGYKRGDRAMKGGVIAEL